MQATGFRLVSSAISSSGEYIRSSLCWRRSTRRVFYLSPHSSSSFHSRNLSSHSPTALGQINGPTAKDRVLIFRSSSTDPYVNLSLEHYLLQNAHPESKILFLYVNQPCVVIGRNQNPWIECALRRLSHEPLSLKSKVGSVSSRKIGGGGGNPDVLLVRRRSGGGAVFHDEGNLNYSVIVPSHAKVEFKRKTHAQMVVRAVRAVQKDLIESTAPLEALEAAVETESRFDLHAVEEANVRVNDRNDIVMDDPQRGVLKVSGSAFKLTKGRALHHGTLLFSSPNLKEIGDFLKSPARDFISAKGVESVRSPVGNLFDLPHNERQREMLRRHLEMSIAGEFRKMYGKEANARLSPLKDHSEITRGELPEDICSEIDGRNETGADIMKGVHELISPEWKFGQTPGFVVSTQPVEGQMAFSPPTLSEGLPEGAKVFFKVKHGIILESEFSLSSDQRPATREKEQIRSRLQGRTLHEISDWKAVFDGLDAWNHSHSRRLAEWLSGLFPPLPTGPIQTLRPGSTSEKIENEMQDGDLVKRQRADHVIDVERQGERLVEDFPMSDGTRHGKGRS